MHKFSPQYIRNFAAAGALLWLSLLSSSSANAAGVTLITHGFESDSSYPSWVTAMADNIPKYFQARFPGFSNECSTYKLTMTVNDGVIGYLAPVRTNGGPPSATQSGEIIVELDWSALSGNLFDSYASTSNVAFAVSKVLLATNSFPELNGHPAIEFPIHLVGHSRGGSLVSQLSFVLGTNGIWTDHVTTLDPYPINNDGNIDFPASVEDASAASTYASVLFADNYWQNLGAGAFLGDPDGEPVNGAYVRQLTDLSGGYGFDSDHENVHLWYHGTVDLQTPASDSQATITSTERAAWWVPYEGAGVVAGFYYSLIGGGNRTNTLQPLGPGFDSIAHGYNQLWNFGAGSSDNRMPLPANAGTWPNLIQFNITSTNIVTAGQVLATKFYYQYGGASNSVTAQFYFDTDLNPYNTNGTWITDLVLTNTGVDAVYFDDGVNLTTTNVAPGVYTVYAKISDGAHTRYLYAPEPVEIIGLQQPQGMSLGGDLAFGNVMTGAMAQGNLVISNGGASTLIVTNITYPTGFSGSWSGTIPAGNSETVPVTFAPVDAINYGGTVTVVANNTSGFNTILISGMGTNNSSISNPITMSLSGNLTFGSVPVGASAQSTLTISNAGQSQLIVSSISYPTGFSGSWSGTLAAGAKHLVTVTFSPTAATTYGSTVTVHADNTVGSNTISISGTGIISGFAWSISTNGAGAVSPNLNGKVLTAGKTYTLTATPKTGYVFSNWTGSFTTNKNPLSLKAESNLVLQANFIPNPFVAAKGTYNGLFFDATNGVAQATAGMLKSLVVGLNGTYSGSLWVNGQSHSLSGSFDLAGQATNQISRTASQGGPLTVEMMLNWNDSPPDILGTVSGSMGAWKSTLTGVMAVQTTNSAEYTVWLTGVAMPPGDGYILMTNHAGTVVLSVSLADGTSFSQSVPISSAGDLPVYGNLYGGDGLLLGWLDLESGSPTGNLAWIKPASRASALYTNGFTNQVSMQGSIWTNPPPHTAALDFPSGQLAINSEGLPTILTFNVALSNNNALVKLPGSPTNSLTGTLNPKTGLLTVQFGNGSGKATTSATAAALQNTNQAAGFFLGKTNAGSMFLRPAL